MLALGLVLAIIPVTCDINRKTLCQKLVRPLQAHRMWNKVPECPHPIQQRGELSGENFAKWFRVKYH